MIEPGELPLLRELPGLKRKQGLKDSFKMPPSKSPLLRASPLISFNTVNPSLQRTQGKGWEAQCNDFYNTPPEAGSGYMWKTSADLRGRSDMSKDGVLELDSTPEEHEGVEEQLNRWRNPREVHRQWEFASSEPTSRASNSSEEGDFGGSGQDQIDPSSTFPLHRDGGSRHLTQHFRVGGWAKRSSQRTLKYGHSYNHNCSSFSQKPIHQAELAHHRHSWTAGGRREIESSRPTRRALTAPFSATKRAAKTRPEHAFVSGSQPLWQSQATGKQELMMREMHSLDLNRGMVMKPQVSRAGQSKPHVAEGADASRKKSVQQHLVKLSSVMENCPSSEPCHWSASLDDYEVNMSGPQDNYESGMSTCSSVDEDGCDRLPQNEACPDGKLRFPHKPPLSTVSVANHLQLAIAERKDLVIKEDKPRSLSQKYRPRLFGEIVGHHIVTQSLSNAILKGKIVPVYLFQGPRGTGKTSTARIFAAALLCAAPQGQRPCGHCGECASVRLCKSSHVKEVDAASHNGIAKVKVLLEEVIMASSSSCYKVFIIDECHTLTTETWSALLKILEEPPMNVVFILITTDPEKLPGTTVSRCQRFPFPKIKDVEIVKRLTNLTSYEGIKLDSEVLKLIASRSDGSLRDAEMILDQLSLLGQEINSSTVHELVGSASEGRIVSLLDSALLADTVSTIKKARELVDSGVQPLSLMSHMATLIIDILAGSHTFTEEHRKGFFRRKELSEGKLERLRKAVNTLSEAEKQLRVSQDKMTWLIAALLQLGPDQSCVFPVSVSGTSITQSPNTHGDIEHGVMTDVEQISVAAAQRHCGGDVKSSKNSHQSMQRAEPLVDQLVKSVSLDRPVIRGDVYTESLRNRTNPAFSDMSVDNTTEGSPLTSRDMEGAWSRVLQICRPFRLRQSLQAHGKLVFISLSEASAVVHLEFIDATHKTRCERSQENISSAFEAVLGCPVEVKYTLVFSDHGVQGHGSARRNEGLAQSVRDNFMSSGALVGNVPAEHDGHHFSPASPDHPAEHDGHHFSPASPDHTFIPPDRGCSSRRFCSEEAKLLSSEEQLDKAWICDTEPSSSSSDTERMSLGGVADQTRGSSKHREAQPDMALKAFLIQEPPQFTVDPYDWACHDVKEMVELDTLPSKSRTFGLWDDPEQDTLTVSSGPERGTTGGASAEKKGSALKAMQRFTFRRRNRSLIGAYQNCTEEQVSLSFASSEAQRNSQINIDSKFSGDVSAHSMKGNSRLQPAAPFLRNKLRGAAGNVARFFQGKLSRSSQDTFPQCM